MSRQGNDPGLRPRDEERQHAFEGSRRSARDEPYHPRQSFGNPQFDETRGYGTGASGGDLRDDWQDRNGYAYENTRNARSRYAGEFGRHDNRFDRYPDSPQGLSSGEWRDQYRDSGLTAPRSGMRFDSDSPYGWQSLDAPHPQDFHHGARPDRFQEAERYATDVRYGRPDISAPQPRRQTPKGYVRSDARIEDDLCEHLYHANDVDVAEVSISVKNGTVSLQGSVPERRMKHRIEDICERCIGVTDVENRIRVAAPGDVNPSRGDLSTGRGTQTRKEGGNPAAH